VYARRRDGEKGSAIIAAVIIGALLIALFISHSNWATVRTQNQTHVNASKAALSYAETGTTQVITWLRKPSLNDDLPVAGSTTLAGLQENGRFEVAVYRRNADSNLVDFVSTGYYNLPRGTDMDAGKPVQIAVVAGKARLSNVGEYLAATSAPLKIGYGTDVQNGSVYSQDLTFEPDNGLGGPPTQVAHAYYLKSVTGDLPGYYTQDPKSAQQLAYPPEISTLDPAVRQLYIDRKSNDPMPSFTASVTQPSDTHVYFQDGDIEIATGGMPLSVSGVFVLYATGHVYIHNSVIPADANSWIAIISEKDIHLTKDAPDNLEIHANLIANRAVQADPLDAGQPARAGQLMIEGGMASQMGFNFTEIWKPADGATRVYKFKYFNSPNLYLPNFATLVDYHVVRGKYIK
jgi:hypothetical protein